MNQVMIDIETLGTDSNSLVVSISAVQFDLKNGTVGDTFEIGIDLKEQMDKGAIIDADTVMWWLEQSQDAQKQLTKLTRVPVHTALFEFSTWLYKIGVKGLWGNGATFDNVIVRNLYARHSLKLEVPFWFDRDVRTIVAIKNIDTRDFPFVGTKHNGLDDCLHQINYITGDK